MTPLQTAAGSTRTQERPGIAAKAARHAASVPLPASAGRRRPKCTAGRSSTRTRSDPRDNSYARVHAASTPNRADAAFAGRFVEVFDCLDALPPGESRGPAIPPTARRWLPPEITTLAPSVLAERPPWTKPSAAGSTSASTVRMTDAIGISGQVLQADALRVVPANAEDCEDGTCRAMTSATSGFQPATEKLRGAVSRTGTRTAFGAVSS